MFTAQEAVTELATVFQLIVGEHRSRGSRIVSAHGGGHCDVLFLFVLVLPAVEAELR